jgi:malate/lactate dehydrogenase
VQNKIALYGAGNVGATTAHWLAQKKLGDIALFDIYQQIAKGEALDLMRSRRRLYCGFVSISQLRVLWVLGI